MLRLGSDIRKQHTCPRSQGSPLQGTLTGGPPPTPEDELLVEVDVVPPSPPEPPPPVPAELALVVDPPSPPVPLGSPSRRSGAHPDASTRATEYAATVVT